MADPKEDDFLDDIEDAASEEAEVEMIDINEEAAKDQFLIHALHADFGEDVRSNDMDRRVTALEVLTSPDTLPTTHLALDQHSA